MKYVLIGGTFDSLHLGHKRFIEKAFEIGDKVLICITSDKMVSKKPFARMINNYEIRKRMVSDFLDEKGWIERAELIKIENPFSEGLRKELTHIIVSPETKKNAERINEMRKDDGMKGLVIIEIEWINAADGNPISDARIRKREIDSDGNLI